MTIPASGDSFVDALLLGFSGTGTVGASFLDASYTLVARNEVILHPDFGAINPNFLEVNPAFDGSISTAVQAFENVASIDFSRELAPNLDGTPKFLTFDLADLTPGILGVTVPITSVVSTGLKVDSATITFNSATFAYSSFVFGSSAFVTMLHEIGHALGLAHPDDLTGAGGSPFGGTFPDSAENFDYSIMISLAGAVGTFTTAARLPVTPMIYDVAALQYLYGPNLGFNAGDTLHTFTGASVARTLWDAGGLDTIMGSAGADIIDTREGVDKVTSIGEERIWNAFGSSIESAFGEEGNDTLLGDAGANTLYGGAGDDSIIAIGGVDDVNGNTGHDFIDGGIGDDILRGGKNRDSLFGSLGNDSINGNKGFDSIHGGDGNDTLRGGQLNDTILGDAGSDLILGDKGDDRLTGGSGADIFSFKADNENGADTITDFTIGEDKIAVEGLAGGLSLVIIGSSTTVTLTDGSIVVEGVTTLSASDFILT